MSASRCGAVFIFFWVMGLLCVEGHLLSFMGSAGAELGLAAPARGSHLWLDRQDAVRRQPFRVRSRMAG